MKACDADADEIREGITSEGTRRLCSFPYMEYPILLKCRRILLFLAASTDRFCNQRECARPVRRAKRTHTQCTAGPKGPALPGFGSWRKATGSESDIAYSSAAYLALVELTNLSRIRFNRNSPLAPFSPTASGKRPANTLNTESFIFSPSCACDRVRRHAPPNREGLRSRDPIKNRSKGGQRQRIPPGAECPRCHPRSWSLH